MTKEEKLLKKKEYYKKNKDKWVKYNEDSKEYRNEYYQENKEEIKVKGKKRNEENREENLEKRKIYRNKNKDKIKANRIRFNNKESNKAKKKEADKIYYQKNKNKLKLKSYIYKKAKIDNDPLFKLINRIRTRIYNSIIGNGYTKKSKTYEILGCEFNEFKNYIESKFEPWMSWDNYGLYNGEFYFGWDLDHIIPISSAKSEEEILKLNNFNNFQPLCSKINRDIKKNNLTYDICITS